MFLRSHEKNKQVDCDDAQKIIALLIYFKKPKLYRFISILNIFQELFKNGQPLVE